MSDLTVTEMESKAEVVDEAGVPLRDLHMDDMRGIIEHMPEVSISDIFESDALYKLALIYAARGSHHKLIQKMALSCVGLKDTDILDQIEIQSKVSKAGKNIDFDALYEHLENEEDTRGFALVGKSGYDLITSVLLCGCPPDFLDFLFKQFAVINDSNTNRSNILDGSDNRGLTPLISAVLGGNSACVQHLLDKGAGIEVTDTRCLTEKPEKKEENSDAEQKSEKKSVPKDILYGSSKTPLMYAACTGNSECVRILLKFKPDVTRKCLSGLSAISYAAIASSYTCLELLLTTPVEMDRSQLMASTGSSGNGDTDDSGSLHLGGGFSFTATAKNDKTKKKERVKKRVATLKRKKNEECPSGDTNSSQDEDSGNDDDAQSDTGTSHLPSSNVPFSVDLGVNSPSMNQDGDKDQDKIAKDGPSSFNFGMINGSKIQPRFTIGEGFQKSGHHHPKNKSKPKHRTKKEGKSHNNNFIKQLLDKKSNNLNNIRALAEASVPFAVLGDDIECLKLLLNYCGNLGYKDKFGKTPIMLASERGKTEFVELLLKNWAGVDFPPSLGMDETALMLAAQNGHSACLTVLMNHYANVEAVNWCKETALMYAAKHGRVECLRILLVHKANVHKFNAKEQSPLMIAVENRNTQCIQLLLKHGSVIQKEEWCRKNELMYAAESGNDEILDMILKAVIKQCNNQVSTSTTTNPTADTTTTAATTITATSNKEQIDSKSTSAGVELAEPKSSENDDEEFSDSKKKACNKEDVSSSKTDIEKRATAQSVHLLAEKALPYSVRGGNLACFEMLLPHCEKFNHTEYVDKKTALMLAVEKGHKDFVKLLIEHGVDTSFVSEGTGIHAGNKGLSAVICATKGRNKECLQLLLENGAHPNDGFYHSKMLSQQSAVGVAAYNKDVECLKLLVDHGADVFSENSDLMSAFFYALANEDSEDMLNVLIRSGLKIDIVEFYEKEYKMRKLFRSPKNFETLVRAGAVIMSREVDVSWDNIHMPIIRDNPQFVSCVQLLMEYKLFDWKAWFEFPNVQPVIFLAVRVGLAPKKVLYDKELVSPFGHALSYGGEDYLRYLLSNLYFTWEDYQAFTARYTKKETKNQSALSDSDDDDDTSESSLVRRLSSWLHPKLRTQLCDNPWRLETLCLLKVSSSLFENASTTATSSSVSSQLTRTEQVETLPIPKKFKTILSFKGPHSRLCPEIWSSIAGSECEDSPTPNILCVTKQMYPPLHKLVLCQNSCCTSLQGIGFTDIDKEKSEDSD